MATQLGVQVPQEALLYVIVAPWPDFTLWKGRGVPAKAGLKLLASSPETVRAWPGGIGWAKLGANYGPSFQAHGKCQAQGYDQILWLFGNEGEVTEAGASNFFVIWKNKTTGRKELVTAAVEDQVILPGVVRRSVLDLARERLTGPGDESLEILERKFFITEIVEAWRDGRLIEAFVSGTAYFITSITNIQYKDTDINFPPIPEGKTSYSTTIRSWLSNIMYGPEDHAWGVVVEESE